MTHLLVTNDFPPKVGGIQTYLWELWRRLPAGSFAVLTTAHPGADVFDHAQPFPVERLPQRVLWPAPRLARVIEERAQRMGAAFAVVDPVLPLGLLGGLPPGVGGGALSLPYVVVAHGAEIAVPGRLPGSREALARVLRGAAGAVAAGSYVAGELRRAARVPMEVEVIPPGVDTDRFCPLDPPARAAARERFGLAPSGALVVSVGRLVPRKGADVLIEAAGRLAAHHPDLTVAIAGDGRDRPRLEQLAARRHAPVRFLGRVADADLPALYGCADVFAAPNRSRWGGLEQEGFGIVFLEAAACGVPQVAGNSGGAPEAVEDGETGLVVSHPEDSEAVASALGVLLDDAGLRARLGERARIRAVAGFSYATLAGGLTSYLASVGERLSPGTPRRWSGP